MNRRRRGHGLVCRNRIAGCSAPAPKRYVTCTCVYCVSAFQWQCPRPSRALRPGGHRERHNEVRRLQGPRCCSTLEPSSSKADTTSLDVPRSGKVLGSCALGLCCHRKGHNEIRQLQRPRCYNTSGPCSGTAPSSAGPAERRQPCPMVSRAKVHPKSLRKS